MIGVGLQLQTMTFFYLNFDFFRRSLVFSLSFDASYMPVEKQVPVLITHSCCTFEQAAWDAK